MNLEMVRDFVRGDNEPEDHELTKLEFFCGKHKETLCGTGLDSHEECEILVSEDAAPFLLVHVFKLY